jgi:hypothetical protein
MTITVYMLHVGYWHFQTSSDVCLGPVFPNQRTSAIPIGTSEKCPRADIWHRL